MILEGVILTALVVINTIGIIIAWQREKIGGIIFINKIQLSWIFNLPVITC